MSDHRLPDSVTSFVLENILSMEQLEILLLLRRHKECEWTAEAVGVTLRKNPESVASWLSAMQAQKLLSRRDEAEKRYYRFAPAAEHSERVDLLAQYFASHPVRIVELIYTRSAEAIRAFAEAFRFRQGRDD